MALLHGLRPGLVRSWTAFRAALVRHSGLTRADTTLIVERTLQNVEGRSATPVAGADQRQRALLRPVDELCADRMISDATWEELRAVVGDRAMVALPLVVGDRAMSAMITNTLAAADGQPPVHQAP